MKFRTLMAAAMTLCTFVSALADGPYRTHRYDSFMSAPPAAQPGTQIVFLGNSITNMHNWNEAFGSDARIVGRGNSGGFAYEWIEEIESVVDSKPAKVFIGIGTNDLSSGEDNDATVTNIDLIVKRIQLASPETEIYVQSILPRSSNQAYVMPKITDVNAKLKALYEGTAVHFVDLTNVMAGMQTANGNDPATSFAPDGLHPSALGYRAWCEEIKDMVNGTCSYSHGAYHPELTAVYNPSRVSQFSLLPVDENDILFVGDEMVENGEWNELLGLPNLKKRANGYGHGGVQLCQSGYVMTDALGMIKASLTTDATTQHAPKQIIIYCGVNELNNGEITPAAYKTRYQTVVDYIKSVAPATKILAVSLLDVNGKGDRTVQFNSAISEIAAADPMVDYVDIYTPMKANAANSMQGNYVNGRGYVRIANLLAPHIEGANAVSLDDFEKYYAQRQLRKRVGVAYNRAYKVLASEANFGTEPGFYNPESREAFATLQAKSGALLANLDAEVTEAQVSEIEADLSAAVAAGLNMPQEGKWYVLRSARGSRYVKANGTRLEGAEGDPADPTDGTDVWQFALRADGTYNISNPLGKYINNTASQNAQLRTATNEPKAGWELSNSNVGAGTYVIYSTAKSCQFNQTGSAQSFQIYNWHGGTVPNRTDEGCAYFIQAYDGEVPAPAEEPKEEEGAISEVSSAPTATLYDLQGRALATRPRSGLYIANGKVEQASGK